MDERVKVIRRAKENDLELTLSDFKKIDGEWTLDGMDPGEWLDAMLMG
jgi:hypothetical protein